MVSPTQPFDDFLTQHFPEKGRLTFTRVTLFLGTRTKGRISREESDYLAKLASDREFQTSENEAMRDVAHWYSPQAVLEELPRRKFGDPKVVQKLPIRRGRQKPKRYPVLHYPVGDIIGTPVVVEFTEGKKKPLLVWRIDIGEPTVAVLRDLDDYFQFIQTGRDEHPVGVYQFKDLPVYAGFNEASITLSLDFDSHDAAEQFAALCRKYSRLPRRKRGWQWIPTDDTKGRRLDIVADRRQTRLTLTLGYDQWSYAKIATVGQLANLAADVDALYAATFGDVHKVIFSCYRWDDICANYVRSFGNLKKTAPPDQWTGAMKALYQELLRTKSIFLRRYPDQDNLEFAYMFAYWLNRDSLPAPRPPADQRCDQDPFVLFRFWTIYHGPEDQLYPALGRFCETAQRATDQARLKEARKHPPTDQKDFLAWLQLSHVYKDEADALRIDIKTAKEDIAKWTAQAKPYKPLRPTWEKRARLDILGLLGRIRDEQSSHPASRTRSSGRKAIRTAEKTTKGSTL